jgi:hypothetical protein
MIPRTFSGQQLPPKIMAYLTVEKTTKNIFLLSLAKKTVKNSCIFIKNRPNFWQNIFGGPLPLKIVHYR